MSADGVDPAAAVATVQRLWACIQARDWAGLRALLADDARMCWRTSGECFDDADAIVRVNAIYPEGWTLQLHDVAALADGRVHSRVEVRHGGQRFIASSLFVLRAGLIAEIDECWATWEAPPAWRTAAAIGAYRCEDAWA